MEHTVLLLHIGRICVINHHFILQQRHQLPHKWYEQILFCANIPSSSTRCNELLKARHFPLQIGKMIHPTNTKKKKNRFSKFLSHTADHYSRSSSSFRSHATLLFLICCRFLPTQSNRNRLFVYPTRLICQSSKFTQKICIFVDC